MHYTHLAKEERYYIFCSLKSGKSMRTIARELNRSTATVSREYARNKGLRGYRYQQAERKSQERQAHKPCRCHQEQNCRGNVPLKLEAKKVPGVQPPLYNLFGIR